MYGGECGCRKCQRKHEMMFWTIVALLLVIIMILTKSVKI